MTPTNLGYTATPANANLDALPQLPALLVAPLAAMLPSGRSGVLTFAQYLANNAFFNVKDFGAKGDGLADDTAAIQAAINAANPSGPTPGVVYVPAGVYIVSSLTVPLYTVLLGPGWQLAALKAKPGATGYMLWDQDLNGTGIRIIGLGLDGNNQNISGLRFGFHDTGSGSFNYGAFLKDVRVQRCLGGYAFDIQANVAELEDCWASHGNAKGFRLLGIDIRGHRLACEDSTISEFELGAQGSTIEKLHIETSINKPIKFLATAIGSQIKGVSLSVDVPATTIPTLVEFDAAATWNSVQDLSVNLDQAGSDYTNVISDLNWPRTVLGTSLTNKRQAGSYYQDGYDLDVRLRSMRGTYASPAALAVGNTNDYATAEYATLRVTANAGNSTLTGLAGGIGGRRLRLININGGTLTLAHANGGSLAANQILSPTGADYVLAQNDGADLEYDASTLRWRILARSGVRMELFGWAQVTTVAASQTDAALTDAEAARGRVMVRGGSITGVGLNASSARTAGTLTVKVQKSTDGGATWSTVVGPQAVLNTNVKGSQATFAKGLYTFAAGDMLRTTVTTDGAWTPTANNLDAVIEVET